MMRRKKIDKELTATDRKNAIEITDVDMYQFNKKHPISNQVVAVERYMVIYTKTKKLVFRETLEAKDSGIVT